jgi:glycosyltransferase involved in cell wall biosynthesis
MPGAPMKRILHILQRPLPAETDVFSGNDLRTRQLGQGLQEGGHSVSHAFLRGPGQASTAGAFRNRDELQGILLRDQPDVILVAYWELLALLPFELQQPVVLDFVAPRPLEELFEAPHKVQASLARLRNALARCDRVLCGNQRQADLLIPLLIEAGHDLRGSSPLLIVPLGAPLAAPPTNQPDAHGMMLVMGGVSWPWRNEQSWLEALQQAAMLSTTPVQVQRFAGSYQLHADAGRQSENAVDGVIHTSPLLPYTEYSEFLTHRAHAGIELADWNLERAFSQSFRSLDFLRHGLPLICNRYLPLAAPVEKYDAGWLLDQPDEIARVLSEICRPELWRLKSANARRLAAEALSVQATTAELLAYLQQPRKSPRLPAVSASENLPPVLGVPPMRQRLKRQWGLLRQVITARVFGQKKSGEGILFVTRSDLFPPDHGAAVRTVETARALGRQGLPVGIVTDNAAYWYKYENGEFTQQRYPLWLHLVSLPSALVKLLHYSKDIPQSNAFLYLPLTDGGFFWRILAAGKTIRANILQAEFPAYAEPCLRAQPVLATNVVLVEHNVEYRRLREQLAELSDEQYQRFKAIEINLCQQVDAVVCVSDSDRQILLDAGVPAARLSTIPHGVHLARYSASADAGIRHNLGIAAEDLLLVYHGTFSYPPNRQAMGVFAAELLPRLEKLGLMAHVLAVGKDAPASSPHERIHFTGSVLDVAPYLKAADVAVIPLTEGGGTRMKIIDCFAAQLPVISTAKGIEGIPVEPGRQALVLDDWQAMAEAIADLYRHPAKRLALANAGHELVATLDWSEIARRYRALYSSLA